ncbi:hypothetical protein K435DRAFT_347419 [Dendrothele bispora CBS 962.96]|uniref:J domain-containing protein n=1 Tax=Dendrothele bispora (strain CBS 962.96) TaxID=1314807 RepID=A0A4S8LE65_DENBC|nr:hypothetical protein K435DRAFT_347419 [Dendrothele bispora CBS 962.96]
MPTRSAILQAYSDLGVQEGASLEAVRAVYKQVTPFFSSDRLRFEVSNLCSARSCLSPRQVKGSRRHY